MKKLVLKWMMVSFLVGGLGIGVSLNAQNHDSVSDSLSIDDMDPVFLSEEDYEDESEGSNGAMIAIVIVSVLAIGGIVYKVVSGKKK